MSETKKTETKKAEPKQEKKTETKQEPTKKSSSINISSTKWSLAKVAFVIIFAVAVLYLINSFFAIFGVGFKIIATMQAVCSALALALVGFVGWDYVKNKQDNIRVAYVVAMVVVLVGIIIPVVF